MAATEAALGKLKNLATNEELAFPMNPTEYHLSRGFDYAVEPCLGQPAPVVAYRSGHAAELSFQLLFDQDAERTADVKKLVTFVKGLGKIHAETKSVPVVEFAMGTLLFRGYPRQLVLHPYRFDAHGNATGARLEISLLSNGDYEHGRV